MERRGLAAPGEGPARPERGRESDHHMPEIHSTLRPRTDTAHACTHARTHAHTHTHTHTHTHAHTRTRARTRTHTHHYPLPLGLQKSDNGVYHSWIIHIWHRASAWGHQPMWGWGWGRHYMIKTMTRPCHILDIYLL